VQPNQITALIPHTAILVGGSTMIQQNKMADILGTILRVCPLQHQVG